MIEKFKNFKLNEKRVFTLKELREKSLLLLKSLGIKIPSEEDINNTITNIKNVIINNNIGLIQESDSNLDKSIKAMSKFGIKKDIHKKFISKRNIHTREEISYSILDITFDQFGEYSDKYQEQIALKLAEKLTDELCQDYVDKISNSLFDNISLVKFSNSEFDISDSIIKKLKFNITDEKI